MGLQKSLELSQEPKTELKMAKRMMTMGTYAIRCNAATVSCCYKTMWCLSLFLSCNKYSLHDPTLCMVLQYVVHKCKEMQEYSPNMADYCPIKLLLCFSVGLVSFWNKCPIPCPMIHSNESFGGYLSPTSPKRGIVMHDCKNDQT